MKMVNVQHLCSVCGYEIISPNKAIGYTVYSYNADHENMAHGSCYRNRLDGLLQLTLFNAEYYDK